MAAKKKRQSRKGAHDALTRAGGGSPPQNAMETLSGEESPFSHIKHIKKRAVLAALSGTGNQVRACEIAGCHRVSLFLWRRDDEEFARLYDVAMSLAADALESECFRRAMEGNEKPVFQGGKKVGVMQEYSDTLAIFLLKGARPEKYRERWSGELSGPGGAPIESSTSIAVEFVDSSGGVPPANEDQTP